MKESTLEIQHLVDWDKIEGSADLTREQKNLVVSKLIEEDPSDGLLEKLIERHTPDELPRLMAELYAAKDKQELIYIAKKLQKSAKAILDHHYDELIDDVISDHRFSKVEDKITQMRLSNCFDALADMDVPYGHKSTLGGI